MPRKKAAAAPIVWVNHKDAPDSLAVVIPETDWKALQEAGNAEGWTVVDPPVELAVDPEPEISEPVVLELPDDFSDGADLPDPEPAEDEPSD